MDTKTATSRLLPCLMMFLCTPSILLAQQDSSNIRRKILASEESDQMLVQRTRNFILTQLASGNIDEACEAYNYALDDLESERTKPFWIDEQFLLGYWFGKYEILYRADSIESSMYAEGSTPFYSPREYLFPQRDRLAMDLRTMSRTHRPELVRRIDSLVDEKENHDFLVLFFDWLTLDPSEQGLTERQAQEYLETDLTPRAEEFLLLHRDSRFTPFVQRHFRYVYVLKDWGYGYYLGLGSLTPQSTAGTYLKPEFTLGMGLDVSWKRLLMNLGFDIGVPVAIRKPFVYEGKTWTTDVRHNYYAFYAAPGVVVGEGRQFKLSPHIGIGAIHMSVCEGDQDKAGGDFSMSQATMQYGLICDIKLGIDDAFFKENVHSYSAMRVAFDYFQFLGGNPIMSGGMLRFNIAWIGFGRPIVRDM